MLEALIKFLVLFSTVQLVFADKLLLVHTIWRHGERNPRDTFPTDPYKNHTWHTGYSQLTALGMEKQFELGKWFRQKYVVNSSFLSTIYNINEVYIKSSNLNRTIISAQSVMNGMYGYAGIPGLDFPVVHGWPIGFVPVPIHTVTPENVVEVGFPIPCARRDQLMNLVLQSPQYLSWRAENQELINNVSQLTGLSFNNIDTFIRLAATLENQRALGLSLPQWENDYFEAIQSIWTQYQRFMNGYDIGIINGINVTHELRVVQGGSILLDMVDRMRYKAACVSGSSTLDCSWLNKVKFVGLCTSDVMIMGVLSTFEFEKLDFDVDQGPPTNGAILLELWSRNDNSTYVKALYKRPNEPEVDMTNHISGCQSGCSLDAFVQRSIGYRPLPNVEQWCKTPLTQV